MYLMNRCFQFLEGSAEQLIFNIYLMYNIRRDPCFYVIFYTTLLFSSENVFNLYFKCAINLFSAVSAVFRINTTLQ